MSLTQRNAWLAVITLYGLIFAPAFVQAQGGLFVIEETKPTEFEDVEELLEPNNGIITNELERAQCGGWDFTKSVEGYISEVTGVPGRTSDPLGNIESGMARRNEEDGFFEDGYEFPTIDDAQGFSTACTMKELNDADDFEKPERLVNCKSPEECQELCVDINKLQYQAETCIENGTDVVAHRKLRNGKCVVNNAAPRRQRIPAFPGAGPGVECFREWRYCCTDALVTQRQYNQCTLDDAAGPGSKCAGHNDALRNCVRCAGDGIPNPDEPDKDINGDPLDRPQRNETGCRWGGLAVPGDTNPGPMQPNQLIPIPIAPPPDNESLPDIIKGQFFSFFRRYNTRYQRDALEPPENNNIANNSGETQCYGLYQEFDPRHTPTITADLHCIMLLPAQRFQNVPRFIGQFGKEEAETEFPPFQNIRPFDKEQNLWNTTLSDSFSLLNPEKFNNNFTEALLSLDEATLVATPQLPDGRPYSDGGLMRAFDDTVTNAMTDEEFDEALGEKRAKRSQKEDKQRDDQRVLVEWWQEQQTEMSKYFTPATVRLWLPTTTSLLGSDAFKRLLDPDGDGDDDHQFNIMTEHVEVQLRAGESSLDEIAAILEASSFLDVEEVPIPVVVPLISQNELLSLEHQWCMYYMRENDAENCDSPEGDIGTFIEKLREYREQIDDVNAIRHELPKYMSKLLKIENTFLTAIHDWYIDVNDDFVLTLDRSADREEFREDWEEIQALYREIHDQVTMPWCHNTRFTTPIYSLVDPWLPSRYGEFDEETDEVIIFPGDISNNNLPKITVERQSDIIIDFSLLSMRGVKLQIPVLKPVQVRMDIVALSVEGTGGQPPELEELPPVPELSDIVDASIDPEVEEDFPLIRTLLPPEGGIQFEHVEVERDEFTDDMTGMEKYLFLLDELLVSMGTEYFMFWNSFSLYQEGGDPPKCNARAGGACVHVEMDLKERWQRATARYGVFLQEDFASKGDRRDPSSEPDTPKDIVAHCEDTDWACQPLNPQDDYPAQGWHTVIAEDFEEEFAENIIEERKRLFQEQPEDIQLIQVPLLPSYDVPQKFEIIPPPDEL